MPYFILLLNTDGEHNLQSEHYFWSIYWDHISRKPKGGFPFSVYTAGSLCDYGARVAALVNCLIHLIHITSSLSIYLSILVFPCTQNWSGPSKEADMRAESFVATVSIKSCQYPSPVVSICVTVHLYLFFYSRAPGNDYLHYWKLQLMTSKHIVKHIV